MSLRDRLVNPLRRVATTRAPLVTALLLIIAGLVLTFAAPASALDESGQDDPPDSEGVDLADVGVIEVLEVNGFLDPLVLDFVTREIEAAGERPETIAIVLQVNSSDMIISEAELVELAATIDESTVPVSAWVGPSSSFTGPAAQLLDWVDTVGLAQGSRVGALGPALVRKPAGQSRFDDAGPLLNKTLDGGEGFDAGIADIGPEQGSVLGQFLTQLPGVQTTIEPNDEGESTLRMVSVTRLRELPIVDQLFHTAASPPVAYLLLVIGLALLLFEFYTAGVGVAGGVAVICLFLAAYGLAVLPTRPLGLALMILAFVALAVDTQTGIPRFWVGAGLVLLMVATFLLFDGVPLSWLPVVVAFVGTALAFTSGMPSMIRARFATPTIGREWLVGEMGTAVGGVSPEGYVEVRGAQWRAFTNRATPLDDGDSVRVLAVDGFRLEVEPEEGGARDYRDRGSH
ncbi:MAG: hypothetical protein GY713_04400 [Actinomycetia bacterium]|nr:hypothetical protein [Actinomycetes bacterium]